MPRIAFLFAALICAGYFLVRRRRTDFCSVFAFTGLLYTVGAMRGYVAIPKLGLHYDVPSEVYWSLSAFFVVTAGVAAVWDARIPPRSIPPQWLSVRPELFWLMGFCAIGVAVVAWTLTVVQGGDILAKDVFKKEWSERLGRPYVVFQFAVIFSLVCCYMGKARILWIAGGLLAALDVYLGNREVPVISAVAVAVIWSSRADLQPLWRRWRFVILALLVTIGLILYKEIYVHVRQGEAAKVATTLGTSVSDPVGALMRSEAGTQLILFCAVAERDFRLEPDYLFYVPLALIPFVTVLGGNIREDFNFYVQEPLLGVSNARGGLAASNFGEWYAIGGWLGFLLFAASWMLVFCVGGRWLARARHLAPTVAVMFAWLSFYNYRNSLLSLLTGVRRSFLIGIGLIIAAWLLAWGLRQSGLLRRTRQQRLSKALSGRDMQRNRTHSPDETEPAPKWRK